MYQTRTDGIDGNTCLCEHLHGPGFDQKVDFASDFQTEYPDCRPGHADLKIYAAKHYELRFICVADNMLDDSLKYISCAGLGKVFAGDNDILGTNPDSHLAADR